MASPLSLFLIEQDGNILVVRRKADSGPFAGQWTLPGDAFQSSETAPEAARRFARDELAVTILGEELVETLTLESEAGAHQTWVYRVGFDGRLRFRSAGPFEEVGWAAPGRVPAPMAPPMSTLVARLLGSKVG